NPHAWFNNHLIPLQDLSEYVRRDVIEFSPCFKNRSISAHPGHHLKSNRSSVVPGSVLQGHVLTGLQDRATGCLPPYMSRIVRFGRKDTSESTCGQPDLCHQRWNMTVSRDRLSGKMDTLMVDFSECPGRNGIVFQDAFLDAIPKSPSPGFASGSPSHTR